MRDLVAGTVEFVVVVVMKESSVSEWRLYRVTYLVYTRMPLDKDGNSSLKRRVASALAL